MTSFYTGKGLRPVEVFGSSSVPISTADEGFSINVGSNPYINSELVIEKRPLED